MISGSDFTDMANGARYANAAIWVGYGNWNFVHNNPITRKRLAVMLCHYSGSPATTNKELHFNSVDEISGFVLEALRWVVESAVSSTTMATGG